jgi:hypothetical protein
MRQQAARGAVTAIAMVGLAWVASLAGCDGRNECEKAGDHLAECLNIPPPGQQAEAEDCGNACSCSVEANLCWARCANASDCAAIQDAFLGMPAGASGSLSACWLLCATLQ